MATQTNPVQIATSLCSMLKIVKEPTSADVLGSSLKLKELAGKLPEFFKSLRNEINPKVQVASFIFERDMNERYILVLGQICKVLGTCIYTKQILEDDETEPKQMIILTAYQPEFILVNHIIKYLNHFIQGMQKTHKLFEGNKTKVRAEREKEYLNSILEAFTVEKTYSDYRISEKRFKLVLHEVIKMYKFEYKNNKGNPQYGGILVFKNIITKGKWKKHKLLWN